MVELNLTILAQHYDFYQNFGVSRDVKEQSEEGGVAGGKGRTGGLPLCQASGFLGPRRGVLGGHREVEGGATYLWPIQGMR